MTDEQHTREQLSALADGQLRGNAFAQAVQQACSDADAQATWQAYHVVGDVLRSEGLARRDTGVDFTDRVLARLQQEDALRPIAALQPVSVDAPVLIASSADESVTKPLFDVKKEAANASSFRWKMVAGFASLAAVAAIGWNSASTLWTAPDAARLAQAPVVQPLAMVSLAQNAGAPVMLRDARLDELLAAHKQLGGNSALQMPAGFLRNATFEGNAR